MIKRGASGAGAAVLAHFSPAYACSGPGAVEFMARNVRIGEVAFLIALAGFMVSIVVRRRKNRPLVPFAMWGAFLAIFPFIDPNPLVGDCGIAFRNANVVLAAAYAIILLLQLRAGSPRRAA